MQNAGKLINGYLSSTAFIANGSDITLKVFLSRNILAGNNQPHRGAAIG